MTQYYSPKCNDTDKLVKSRCQCKKSTKKTVKIKVVKKPKTNLKITVKKMWQKKTTFLSFSRYACNFT